MRPDHLEFVAALMRPVSVPVTQQAREPVTFRDLAARMAALSAKHRYDLTDTERKILDRYYAGVRHIARAARMDQSCSISVAEPAARPDRPKAGERFVEPKRRLPTDMQAGRVKARRAPEWN